MTTPIHEIAANVIDDGESASADRSEQLATILDSLTGAAQLVPDGGPPKSFAAGTFAMYPMPAGGIMVTMKIDEGPLAGPVQHVPIPAGIIRAMTVIAGGGSKVQALRAMVSRKAIGG
jgi:hypothetical protein